jgi:hypothetical protein
MVAMLSRLSYDMVEVEEHVQHFKRIFAVYNDPKTETDVKNLIVKHFFEAMPRRSKQLFEEPASGTLLGRAEIASFIAILAKNAEWTPDEDELSTIHPKVGYWALGHVLKYGGDTDNAIKAFKQQALPSDSGDGTYSYSAIRCTTCLGRLQSERWVCSLCLNTNLCGRCYKGIAAATRSASFLSRTTSSPPSSDSKQEEITPTGYLKRISSDIIKSVASITPVKVNRPRAIGHNGKTFSFGYKDRTHTLINLSLDQKDDILGTEARESWLSSIVRQYNTPPSTGKEAHCTAF